ARDGPDPGQARRHRARRARAAYTGGPPAPDHAMPDADLPAPTRLDKRVADLVRCSRADAQQYIAGGWVSVDGRVVEDAQTPVTNEVVELAPGARLETAEPATMLLHKPAGMETAATPALVTPATRTNADTSGLRTLQRHFQH